MSEPSEQAMRRFSGMIGRREGGGRVCRGQGWLTSSTFRLAVGVEIALLTRYELPE
jgi:hypothetical protein